MNLHSEMKTTYILVGIGICVLGGVGLAYVFTPHIIPSNISEETITVGGAPRSNDVNKPPTGIKKSPRTGICAQVITPARNPETGEQRNFPTPCDVPEGWEPLFPTPDRPQ